MAKVFCALLTVAAASAVQVSYVAPVASGYIYRSDNGGPASLTQLGAQRYEQPHTFTAPLPIAQPIAQPKQHRLDIETYDYKPVLLKYIEPAPKIYIDVDDDDAADSVEYLDSSDLNAFEHGKVYENGAGSDYGEKHHAAHGEKGRVGYSSKDHHASGESGDYNKEHEAGYASQAKGENGAHHDVSEAHGKNHEAGSSYKGGNEGHKKHFSKGEDITGYHKVFHKDEFKKDHDFYDVADNIGHFNTHGNEKGHHGSKAGDYKEGRHSDDGFAKGEVGKAGIHAKGHHDESDHSHSAELGNESDYYSSHEYGKKGDSGNEKDYAYEDDDDDDDDDDNDEDDGDDDDDHE